MQKDPPIPTRHEFNEKAPPTVEQKMNERVSKLFPKHQEQYQKLCKTQERSLEYFKEDLNQSQESRFKRFERDILDQKIEERKMAPRPKFAAPQSNQELARLAQDEASVKVQQDDEQKISIASARFMQERHELIDRLELTEEHLAAFEKSSKGVETDIGKDSEDNGR